MIKVAPYDPQHLEQLAVREGQSFEKPSVIQGDAVTFLFEEKPIAIFGGYQILLGVLQLWGLVSDDVAKCPKSFHKSSKEFLSFVIEKQGIRRVQISVRHGNTQAWRWATALGFRCEGIMRKYGPDSEDYYLFARIA